jgi:hypothetical protein
MRAALRLPRRARNPPRRRLFVVEIFSAEDRLEHAFLVRDDERVLDGEDDDRDRQEPHNGRDDDEAHPDEEVADVKRIPHPAENSVRHEPLHVARPAARHGARRGDAREPNPFSDDDEHRAGDPMRRGRVRGRQQCDEKKRHRQPAAIAKEHRADAGASGLLGGRGRWGRLGGHRLKLRWNAR